MKTTSEVQLHLRSSVLAKTTSGSLSFTTLSLVIRWQYPVTLVIPQSIFTFVIRWPQSAFKLYKFRAQLPELRLSVTYPPVKETLSTPLEVIDYDNLTYGDISSTICSEGMKMGKDLKIQSQGSKSKAKY